MEHQTTEKSEKKHRNGDNHVASGTENGAKNQDTQGMSRSEGSLTKQVEKVSSNIPSGAFLTTAVGAMATSALLQVCGKKQASNFIGQWVPTILIIGVYNKLVKLHGSEEGQNHSVM